MVYEQAVKNESKQEWKHPYISIAKGMKSSPNVRSAYDREFFWTTIIAACVIIINGHYTISRQIKSIMMASSKVPKSFLVIRISACWVWWGKRWETSFWTCVPLSKVVVTIVFWNVAWLLYVHSHKSIEVNGYLNR